MAAGINRLRFCLTASTGVRTIAVAGTSGCLLILENPCMAAAGGASPRSVRTGTVVFIHISAEIFCVMAE